MVFESWRAFYQSDWQSVWLLLPVPALFLAWLLASPRARALAESSPEARFLRGWAILFAIETLLDPLIGTQLAAWLALPAAPATAVMLAFVLLGDFRVYWLVFAVTLRDARRGARLAAAVTPIVPLVAWASDGAADAFTPDVSGLRLWLIHELLFTAVAAWLWRTWLPRRIDDAVTLRFLRHVCLYVMSYYALWASCDAISLATALDAAWLLRVLPNQLYYAFFVPFVWLTYSRRR